MKAIILALLGFLIACAPTPTATPIVVPTIAATPTLTPTVSASPTSLPTATATLKPSPTPTEDPSKRYATAFGINYGQPALYIKQGDQTRLSNAAVIDALRRKEPSMANLGEIFFWIQRGFTPWSAGGKTIGAVTTDQLVAERRLGGCHDWGLVYASIARELGYPTVMVDTASIAWAKRTQAGQKGPYEGHVFVEVFINGKWVLVDSTNNWYVETGYDPNNPVIPLKGGIAGSNEETYGFVVMRKGVDSWGYGIRSAAELNRLMDDTARQLKLETLQYPAYTFQRFK